MNDLAVLQKQTSEYNEKWKSKGNITGMFDCPLCAKSIETPMPSKELVSHKGFWDSLTTCYHCGGHFFVVKYPHDDTNPHLKGKIITQTLED